MTYDKQTWQDGDEGGTPITAARLNHIEEGLEEESQDLETHVDASAPHSGHETPAGAQTKANAAVATAAADATTKANAAQSAASDALGTHNSDTTGVHGIDNTEDLVTESQLDAYPITAQRVTFNKTGTGMDANTVQEAILEAAEASLVTDHNADTTNVHGIADTSALETTTGAQAKVDAAIATEESAREAADTTHDSRLDAAEEALSELDLLKMGMAHPLKPTAALYEVCPRMIVGSTLSLSSGAMRLSPIWLPAGTLITSISYFSAGTAMVTGTNQVFALFDSSRALLRQTASDGATAWAANTKKTLNLTSTFTTTYSGLHYLGIWVAAATPPNVAAVVMGGSGLTAEAPTLGGPSNSGLTTTAPNPADAPSVSSVLPYAYVS